MGPRSGIERFILSHRIGNDDPEVSKFEDEYVASVAVADGSFVIGSAGTVAAISTAEGTTQWRSDTEGREVLAPVIFEDMVYAVSHVAIPSDGPMANAYAYGLMAADGTEQWVFQTARPMPSPAVVDGTVHLGPLALS